MVKNNKDTDERMKEMKHFITHAVSLLDEVESYLNQVNDFSRGPIHQLKNAKHILCIALRN